jgi:2-methylcitrate dehydratase PrpD
VAQPARLASPECQATQQKVETAFDQQIEDMGWERIRSRVVVETTDGRRLERWADENYRGSPHNALSDQEVEGKFRDCAAGLLSPEQTDKVLQSIWACDDLLDAGALLAQLDWRR